MTEARSKPHADDSMRRRTELGTLQRRHQMLGERLIGLESEMAARVEEHERELKAALRESRRLRAELDERDREANRLRGEIARVTERAKSLEAERSARAASHLSANVWHALVLDASAPAALAACRALGRAGHDIDVATHDGAALAGYSRYTARVHTLPGPDASQDAFHDALDGILRAHGYDVLVVVDDATLARLADRPAPLPTFPILGPAFQRLIDKVGLADLCRDIGVAYPATLVVSNASEVEAAVASVGLPVVVKAARSAIASSAGVHHHEGATVASDAAAAIAAVAGYRREGLTPIVQEFVQRREKINLSIIRRGGRSEVRFTYRVLRDVPLTGGIAMAMETIDPDRGIGREAVSALERLCDAAGYDGLANGEFCRAPDGRLYLIEVNPRLWGSTWFAERLGQRVVERGARLALGLPSLPEAPYPSGRRFHHATGELRWLRQQRSWRGPVRELLQTTRPWDVFDGDQLSDLQPVLHQAVRGFGRRLRRAEPRPPAPRSGVQAVRQRNPMREP